MTRITLNTSAGALVALADVPEFDLMPGVIRWGDRHFVQDVGFDPEAPIYVEAVCFYVDPSVPVV